MDASPTPTADHTSIYLALIGFAGILVGAITGFLANLFIRPKHKADALVGEAQSESIRVGTVVTILGQLEKMQTNREDSDEAHRKIVRELEAERDRAREEEQKQRDVSAAKWREIANTYLYIELLEDKAGIPQEARYHKKSREQIITGL